MQKVDLTPATVRLLAYAGDPFDLHLVLSLDGAPVDVSQWIWAAWIAAPDGVVIPFLTESEPTGVRLYLRGQDTARLPARFSPYDVTGRDPDAGEGRTVISGDIIAFSRVTPPLRGSAAVAPNVEVTP
jgi:hypothetical protein